MTKQRNNKGQAMVEYIIIVVLIAITLIVLFSKFGKAIGEKVGGATQALSTEQGNDASAEYDKIKGDASDIRNITIEGN